MKLYLLRRTLFLLFLVFWLHEGFCQAPTSALVVHVKDLSVAARDGIAKELGESNDLRLRYACVPAGILVFEHADRSRRIELSDVDPLLHRRIARNKITTSQMDIAEAERLCAQYRQP